jgi:RNA polymerase sigma factor (sigma-70 family)
MKEVLEEISLQKIADGNFSACRYIVDKYKDYVFNIAFRICKNSADAEEVAQDSFMKAFKNIKEFKAVSKFSTWLYRITYNTAVSKTRKNKFFTVPVDEAWVESRLPFSHIENTWEQLVQQDKKKIVKEALEKLSDDEALLINLYYHYDHSFSEISEITGLTVDNIKVKMFRIRKKILDWLMVNFKDEIENLF